MNADGGEVRPPQRVDTIDGLRGIACTLVVFGHLWLIVPADRLDQFNALRGIFYSHNFAVTMFMVIGGLFVTDGLLRERARAGEIDVARFWMRRLLRIGAQLLPLLTTIVVVDRIEHNSPYSHEMTTDSVSRILTFTFNWQLIDDPIGSRADLGHLWYLSVEQQFYLVWIAVLVFTARARGLTAGVLAAGAVGAWIWRAAMLDEASDWWRVSLSTISRVDALCLGSLAAMVYPAFRRSRVATRVLLSTSAASVLTMVLLSPRLGENAYLEAPGVVFALAATGLAIGAVARYEPASVVVRVLSWRGFLVAGRVSLPLYLWHLPVFYAATRWGTGLDWQVRAAFASSTLVAIVALSYYLIERPITSFLRRRPSVVHVAPTG